MTTLKNELQICFGLQTNCLQPQSPPSGYTKGPRSGILVLTSSKAMSR